MIWELQKIRDLIWNPDRGALVIRTPAKENPAI